jgi:hypothetical protein
MSQEIKFHPLADMFPLMEGIGFRKLLEDIRVHGSREPIVVHEGSILDGRNSTRLSDIHIADRAAIANP